MTNEEKNFAENLSALEWYQEAGVDLAVGEKAIDWINAPPEVKDKPNVITPNVAQPVAQQAKILAKGNVSNISNVAIDSSVAVDSSEAIKLAAGAKNLQELKAALISYDGCDLKKRATNMVFGAGNENAKIMFVGKAPSKDDDIEGQIFVGRGGVLLDKMMAAIGLNRSDVYLSNILPWRPPGNRAPTADEIATSMPFFTRQVELVAPDYIFTLGEVAPKILFEEKKSLNKIRGEWRDIKIGSHSVKVICSFHPDFLIAQPVQKKSAWQDLLLLKAALGESNFGEKT